MCGSVNGEHPVGALLTKKRGKDVVVIDGQQRITTTMLLCVALRTAALALKDNELDPTQTYHVDLRIYILERALLMDTDETKPLLEPSFPDRATFAELVCPPALRPATILLIGMLGAKGHSILRNVYSINRGYEDLINRLNTLGAKVSILQEFTS